MRVNLDEIQFYHGPSYQPPSRDAKVPPVHAPQSVQQFFPSGIAVRSTAFGVPMEQGPPLASTTYEWNVFDFEINNIGGSTVPGVIEDVKDEFLLSPSEPPPPENRAPLALEPVVAENLGGVSLDVQQSGLRHDTKEVATPQLMCLPCVTAQAPEEASNAFSSYPTCGDSEQESPNQSSCIAEACRLTCADPEDCEADMDQSQTSSVGGTPCRELDSLEPTGDAGPAESKSSSSRSSSSPECTGTQVPVSESLVRYPSIAVVVPVISWSKETAIRRSTRAAAAACKKRIRASQGSSSYALASSPDLETSLKRRKRSPAKRQCFRDTKAPVHSSYSPHAIRGSAFLSIESDSGQNPAYYFTFVPNAHSAETLLHPKSISGSKVPYSSDENARLVQLREREALPWFQIADYFPGRSSASLQVHYSTKLRAKAKYLSRT